MVHSCVVCKRVDHLNPHLTFHRFPKDPDRRKLWFALVGILENPPLPRYPELCSDHFHPEDIEIRSNGFYYVKRDANPRRSEGLLFLDDFSNSTSSDSTLFATPPPRQKMRISSLCMEDAIKSSNKIEGDNEGFEDISSVPTTSGTMISSLYMEDAIKSANTVEGENEGFDYISSVPTTSGLILHDSGDSSSATESALETEQVHNEAPSILPKSDSMNVKGKKRKRCYVGDMTSSDFSTPEKMKKNVKILKETVVHQRKRIHTMQMKVRRLKNRVTSLTTLINDLKKKSLITETAEASIRASVTGPAADIFDKMVKGTKRYNESLRAFALTLAFYSPRAYNYVRKTFNNSLPHLGTLSNWYKSVNGDPGFSTEALKAIIVKQENTNHPLLCNLVMDEMSIRRQIEWTGKKFTGYVDIGTNVQGDILPEAKEVLVFMLVCLNGSWKVPVGYFLLDGLSANEKANLVNRCLSFLYESGVQITSLTFDGAPANLSMAERLGANFSDPSNLKTSFKHPQTNSDVYVYLDACHMIKLVRNCFASQNGLKDFEERDIKWIYISELVKLQNTEGLHAATKLRLRHLQWEREKMKVRLATQTISKSVSDAITFLREDLKNLNFIESEGTSDFILRFNNLFDTLNSRNKFNKYAYRRPISPENADTFLKFFSDMEKYIQSLTLHNRPILKSPRKTGFLGFLICMESLKKMYFRYVVEEKILKYILTYKLSQDHLELFFGAIRSRGGYNNNPTARQFQAAFKRLLVHTQISGPETGNAVNLENITILTCGSSNCVTISETGQSFEETEEYASYLQKINKDIENEFLNSNAWDLTIYSQDVVAYIAGYVVKSLKRCISCSSCLYLIESNMTTSLLLERKKYGNLIRSSQLVIETCKTAERFFRFFHATKNIFNKNIKNLYEILVTNTLNTLPSSIWDYFEDHIYVEEAMNDHHIQLLKLMLKNYFKIRIYYETVKKLETTRKNRIRSTHTKLILFRNE